MCLGAERDGVDGIEMIGIGKRHDRINWKLKTHGKLIIRNSESKHFKNLIPNGLNQKVEILEGDVNRVR